MVNLIERDLSRRKQACKYELSRLALKCIIADRNIGEQERFRAAIKLSGLSRNGSKTRLRNRCVFTGRGRAVYRFCKLSRIKLRDLAGAGRLPGVTKSSWQSTFYNILGPCFLLWFLLFLILYLFLLFLIFVFFIFVF